MSLQGYFPPTLIDALVARTTSAAGEAYPGQAAAVRREAATILEALVGTLPAEVVLAALTRQGFSAVQHRATLDGLAALARERRQNRDREPIDDRLTALPALPGGHARTSSSSRRALRTACPCPCPSLLNYANTSRP